MDSEGRPLKLLVFRGSPKSSRKIVRHIDEMQKMEAEELKNTTRKSQLRSMPEVALLFLIIENLVDLKLQNLKVAKSKHMQFLKVLGLWLFLLYMMC